MLGLNLLYKSLQTKKNLTLLDKRVLKTINKRTFKHALEYISAFLLVLVHLVPSPFKIISSSKHLKLVKLFKTLLKQVDYFTIQNQKTFYFYKTGLKKAYELTFKTL